MSLEQILEVKPEQAEDYCAPCLAPSWETNPYGLVTLLDMLRYAAEDFYKLSQDLTGIGLMVDALTNATVGAGASAKLQESINLLDKHARALGLTLSVNQIEAVVNAANAVKRGGPSTVLSSAILELNKRVREELGARKFCYIPQEKAGY